MLQRERSPQTTVQDAVRTLQAMAKPWSANMKPVRRAPQREESSRGEPTQCCWGAAPAHDSQGKPSRGSGGPARPETGKPGDTAVKANKQQQNEDVWKNGAAKGSQRRRDTYRPRGPWTGSGNRKKDVR